MPKTFLVKNEDLITIVLFFKSKINKFGVRQYKIVDEDEAKQLIAKNDTSIDTLTTKWVVPTWQLNTSLLRQSTFYNPSDGSNKLDWAKYQDNLFKTCLKEWDISDEEGNVVPVSSESIGNLPSVIATALLQAYESSISMEEDERKK